MREFYVGLDGGPKTRNSKPSSWSVDLTFIDLPTGKALSNESFFYTRVKNCINNLLTYMVNM